MANSCGRAIIPVSEAYCTYTDSGVGPKKTKTSKIPVSDIQWVFVVMLEGPASVEADDLTLERVLRQVSSIDFEVEVFSISIQVSAAFSQKTPTVEPGR